jgi:uncharacterized protein with GYD domain
MANYIIFFGFTQQGIEKIKESPQRVQDAKQIIQSMGGKVKDFYGVLGMVGCDTLFVVEAPNDEVVAKAVLVIARKGHVRTTTVRAFSEAEYKRVIEELP